MQGMMDFEYQDGLKYLQSPFACTEDDQTKTPRNLNILHDQTWLEGTGKLLLKTKILNSATRSLDFHLVL
jgi:hypothetical protein